MKKAPRHRAAEGWAAYLEEDYGREVGNPGCLGSGLGPEYGQHWDYRHRRLKSRKAHPIPPPSSQGLVIKAGHLLGPVGRGDREVLSSP